ncbi:hypothetical protein [Cognaticolwellia beringensis]|uniref:Uncharacterized protein n=1 Tax=Cognaticolwellia beringensis TaxID=1967665 RepID=A0A222G6K7_9GAMM|nr:hypothetical protein [Cognaticolwellia beringensis]ASP47233.1 hypothetical protein B5D82_05340 [Cognaticolwellia beringensis]
MCKADPIPDIQFSAGMETQTGKVLKGTFRNQFIDAQNVIEQRNLIGNFYYRDDNSFQREIAVATAWLAHAVRLECRKNMNSKLTARVISDLMTAWGVKQFGEIDKMPVQVSSFTAVVALVLFESAGVRISFKKENHYPYTNLTNLSSKILDNKWLKGESGIMHRELQIL